jgi:hypothetical protein
MRKVPPVNELLKSNKLKVMGIFGPNTQTVAITQAANGGKATAEISANVPLWEIIIICGVMIVMFDVVKRMLRRSAVNFFDKQVQRARTVEALNVV